MIVSRLAHVALGVPDPDAAARFYGELFGLIPNGHAEGGTYLSGGRSSTYELALGHNDEPVLDHIAFAVTGADALKQAGSRLRDAGLTSWELDCGAEPGLDTGIGFAMPSGHVVELVVEKAPSAYVPVSSADARHHRGVGPVAIEHVTLLCHDIQASAELMVETLGFRISDSVRPPDGPWRNTHLRAGELHHDLAFLPHGEDEPQLHHFCFAVPSVTELVRVADALAARGLPLDASMGRHVAGNNVFLYFKDVAGVRLEVNTDMARVDAAAPPQITSAPVPFDAWREGRPPALASGTPARDGRRTAVGG